MAPHKFTALILTLSSLSLLLISPSHSLTCTSQIFSNKNQYTNCVDLPTLTAYLHWTYTHSTSSLSVAFVATPAQPNGWISWAINPTSTGMVGSQALIAFKMPNGSMTVGTFNITSYSGIAQSKIAYKVSAFSAEHSSNGVMTIFATLALPEATTSVNQVWQVGGSVTGGVPDKHAFQPANLNAKGVLDLVSGGGGGSPAAAPAPEEGLAPAPAAGGPPPSGGNGSGAWRVGNGGFCFSAVLFLLSFLVWF